MTIFGVALSAQKMHGVKDGFSSVKLLGCYKAPLVILQIHMSSFMVCC